MSLFLNYDFFLLGIRSEIANVGAEYNDATDATDVQLEDHDPATGIFQWRRLDLFAVIVTGQLE